MQYKLCDIGLYSCRQQQVLLSIVNACAKSVNYNNGFLLKKIKTHKNLSPKLNAKKNIRKIA